MQYKNRKQEGILKAVQVAKKSDKHIFTYCYQKKQYFDHKLNCKSKYLIYLMKFILCKQQHSGKSKTAYNLRLINHKKNKKLQKINIPVADPLHTTRS